MNRMQEVKGRGEERKGEERKGEERREEADRKYTHCDWKEEGGRGLAKEVGERRREKTRRIRCSCVAAVAELGHGWGKSASAVQGELEEEEEGEEEEGEEEGGEDNPRLEGKRLEGKRGWEGGNAAASRGGGGGAGGEWKRRT
eukprot:767221-Hanusia_phi.AAC.6